MSTKHTPGPWFQQGTQIFQGRHQPIATCLYRDFEVSVENARLIAAAPDLLEALELMIETYPYSPPCYGWQEQVQAHKAARAAIRKATGEEA